MQDIDNVPDTTNFVSLASYFAFPYFLKKKAINIVHSLLHHSIFLHAFDLPFLNSKC